MKLGSFFSRLAFAVKYKQTNFLLNDAVSAKGAKIIFNRDPRERILKVAPFLKADGDPYPAVVDGRVVWIVDCYTTMSNFPYSEQRSLSDLTRNTLSQQRKTAAQPNDKINYIRNSVKATVDAYDGTIKLYQWDNQDPVLKAWMKAFPGLVQPNSAMPLEVRAHVRYPEDLFEVQRGMLEQYHVDDPVTFYNVRDKWTVPTDPYASGVNQPPFYVLANPPAGGGSAAQFQLTSPMKVNNRQNLAAYISVDSDPGTNYGKITVLKLPTTSVVQGPEQISNIFSTTAVISKDISLLSTGGSAVIHGNLLTLPIGDSFLYIEPLYVSSQSATGYPILQRVLAVYGDKIGYAADLPAALDNLSHGPTGVSLSGTGTNTTSPSTRRARLPPLHRTRPARHLRPPRRPRTRRRCSASSTRHSCACRTPGRPATSRRSARRRPRSSASPRSTSACSTAPRPARAAHRARAPRAKAVAAMPGPRSGPRSHGLAHLDLWDRDTDGHWWALLVWEDYASRGLTRSVTVLCSGWLPAADVQRIDGVNYSHVWRARLGPNQLTWPTPSTGSDLDTVTPTTT